MSLAAQYQAADVPSAHVDLQEDHNQVLLHLVVHRFLPLHQRRTCLGRLTRGSEGRDKRGPRLEPRTLSDLLRRLRRDNLSTQSAVRLRGRRIVHVMH